MQTDKIKINTKEIAALSKLSFSKEELAFFEKEMEAFVSFANKISEAQTAKAKTAVLENVLREDEVMQDISPNVLLDAAPERIDSYIKVVKVVD